MWVQTEHNPYSSAYSLPLRDLQATDDRHIVVAFSQVEGEDVQLGIGAAVGWRYVRIDTKDQRQERW